MLVSNKKYWIIIIIIIIIIIKPVSCQTYSILFATIVQKAYVKIPLNKVSLQCSCKYSSISFTVKPTDEVCVEFKLAFALKGSHRTC